jgi:hypothetical protein
MVVLGKGKFVTLAFVLIFAMSWLAASGVFGGLWLTHELTRAFGQGAAGDAAFVVVCFYATSKIAKLALDHGVAYLKSRDLAEKREVRR